MKKQVEPSVKTRMLHRSYWISFSFWWLNIILTSILQNGQSKILEVPSFLTAYYNKTYASIFEAVQRISFQLHSTSKLTRLSCTYEEQPCNHAVTTCYHITLLNNQNTIVRLKVISSPEVAFRVLKHNLSIWGVMSRNLNRNCTVLFGS